MNYKIRTQSILDPLLISFSLYYWYSAVLLTFRPTRLHCINLSSDTTPLYLCYHVDVAVQYIIYCEPPVLILVLKIFRSLNPKIPEEVKKVRAIFEACLGVNCSRG